MTDSEFQAGVNARKLVDELGEMSVGEIADHFTDLGITGMRSSIGQCPAARYLRSQTGVLPSITGSGWTVWGASGYGDDKYMRGDMPAPITKFIQWFDKGAYPHLIEEWPQ